MEQPALEVHPLRQRHFEGGVDGFLRRNRSQRRHRGDGRGGLHRFGDQIGGRHDLRHQPGGLGLGRVHHPAGQAHFHGLGLADGAHQPLRSAHAGDDAQLDLGLAEFGVVPGDQDIGHHGQLAAAAERKAAEPPRSTACGWR